MEIYKAVGLASREWKQQTSKALSLINSDVLVLASHDGAYAAAVLDADK